jgi:hypothetical protein
MRTAASLVLCFYLVSPAVPLVAQVQGDRKPDSLMRSLTSEAGRVARALPSSRVTQTGNRDSSWSRVSTLAPGTEIVVTLRTAPSAGKRYFVQAGASELTVLNLSGLPTVVSRVLREAASRQPGHFEAARMGGTFPLSENVRLAPDGVFLADQNVAELGRIIETIARADVVTVAGPLGTRRGSVVGAVIGASGGLLLGLVSTAHLAFKQCGGSCKDEKALIALSLAGLPVAGGFLGYYARRSPTQGVLYQAP